jgi:P2 family phage contractile tail tube protein
MAIENKQLLSGLNLSVAGVGHIGQINNIDQPDLEFEVVDGVSTGRLKTMFLTIKMGEYNNSLLQQVLQNNLKDNAKVSFVIKGNIHQNAKDIPLMILASGEVHIVKDGTLEINKAVQREMKIRITFYSKTVAGIPEIVVDVPNEIFLIDGIDQYADFRANVLG